MPKQPHFKTSVLPLFVKTAGFLVLIVICCQSVLAEPLVWFNGTFNGINAVSNYQTPSGSGWNYIFDDFVVPNGGWQVAGVFSNNLDYYSSPVNAAHWEIRSGISDGNLGTVVASGTNAASWNPTGITWSGYTEYQVAVNGLNVNLSPGTYWLAVAPVNSNNPPTYLSMTSGTNAVGVPAGNNGNSFGIYAGLTYPENLSTRFGGPTDFSEGIYARTGASQSDPLLAECPFGFRTIPPSDLCVIIDIEVWKFRDVPSGSWFDPQTAYGYKYTMTSSSLFTGILDFPTGFADPFLVSVNGTGLGTFGPGGGLSFAGFPGGGVSEFTVTGINPLVDPTDPLGFPLKLGFSTPTASFNMVALENTSVPEPSSLILLGTGLGGLALAAYRRKKA